MSRKQLVKRRQFRQKVLNDKEAKRALIRAMSGAGAQKVEIDGKTCTVERINIWNRPLDNFGDENQ